MPSDQRNSTMAKDTGLIFSLLYIASAQEVPFEAPLLIKCTLYGLTSARGGGGVGQAHVNW